MLPSWRQCRFFVTINGVSYKKVLPYRGAHHSPLCRLNLMHMFAHSVFSVC